MMVTFFLLYALFSVLCTPSSLINIVILSSIASLRKNVGFILLFGFLTFTFMLLAVGKFTEKTGFVCSFSPSLLR